MYGNCFSLLSPWWIQEAKNDHVNTIVASAWRALWLKILEPLLGARGFTHNEIAALMGSDYRTWCKLRAGGHYEKTGPPVLPLYRIAGLLGVELGEFLPSCRDVHAMATRTLIADAAPEHDLSGFAVEAYVEYHSQHPNRRFGNVDMNAVERTYEVFAAEFAGVEETEAAIVDTARVIDSIFISTGGRS